MKKTTELQREKRWLETRIKSDTEMKDQQQKILSDLMARDTQYFPYSEVVKHLKRITETKKFISDYEKDIQKNSEKLSSISRILNIDSL